MSHHSGPRGGSTGIYHKAERWWDQASAFIVASLRRTRQGRVSRFCIGRLEYFQHFGV